MSNPPPILIVDDDPDDIFILKRLLTKAGIENKTVSFEDPRAAVAHLQAEIHERDERFYPCVVFSDLNMPWLDGEKLTKWIRNQPELAPTKVIIVSSSENPHDAARALAAGADKFFVKYPTASVLQALMKTSAGALRARDVTLLAKAGRHRTF